MNKLQGVLSRLATGYRPATSSRALETFLRQTKCSFQTSPPVEVMERTIDFYEAKPIAGLAREPEADMLLFQYGCYDWGKGEHFEVDLTRQYVAANGDQTLSQLHMTLYFATDPELRRLGAHDRWCQSRSQVREFRATVLDDRVISLVQARSTLKRAITWEFV